MTAVRAANGRMQRYVPDPLAPHVVLQEDDRPAIKFQTAADAIRCAREVGANAIIFGRFMRNAELAELRK